MYIEIGPNNQVIGYSNNNNGVSIYTDLPIPDFTDTQILKFENNQFIVEDSTELLKQKQDRPLRLLRQQRNQLLAATDWRMASDYPGANQTEWQTYRQALRDITTQTPSLDVDGNLTGITWPTRPND